MSTSLPLQGESDKKIGAFAAPLSVTAQDTPAMYVKIRAGSFYNSGNALTQYAGGQSPSIAAPFSGAKWVLVGLSDAGSVVLVNGTNSGAPVLPVVPSGMLVLAAVYVTSTTTSITPALIQDARPFLRIVDSVPDVADALADRPTFTDVANDLALKADVDGTTGLTFALNSGFTVGTPNSDAKFSVKRGSALDVAIRWNESIDSWEFTNDGMNYSQFAATSGTYAPLVHTHVASDITDFTTAVDALIAVSTITESQVTGLVADLAAKASAVALTAHTSDTTIHHTLPLAQTDVTGLTTDLSGKASLTGATFTGTVTVQAVGAQPISLISEDSGSSGLKVDRSTVPGPNAMLEWDESSGEWLVGTVGSMAPISTGSSAVSSVAGRTGAVVLTHTDVTDFNSAVDARIPAPLVTSVAGRTGAVVLTNTDVTGFATVATSGAYSDLTGTPTLAAVAASGSFADLANVPSFANTLYVTTSGNDSTGTGAWNKPFLTPQGAVNFAGSVDPVASSHYIIVVMPGTYAGTVNITRPRLTFVGLYGQNFSTQIGAVSIVNDVSVGTGVDTTSYAFANLSLAPTAGTALSVAGSIAATVMLDNVRVFASLASGAQGIVVTNTDGATKSKIRFTNVDINTKNANTAALHITHTDGFANSLTIDSGSASSVHINGGQLTCQDGSWQSTGSPMVYVQSAGQLIFTNGLIRNDLAGTDVVAVDPGCTFSALGLTFVTTGTTGFCVRGSAGAVFQYAYLGFTSSDGSPFTTNVSAAMTLIPLTTAFTAA